MILITGHKGFVGSKLYKKLNNVIGIDLKEGKDLLICKLPKNIDLIYHLAAQTSVEESWKNPVKDSDNLKILVRLVHNYPNTRIIYTNSAASLKVNSPYGFSKKACADYLKLFHSNYISCILPNLFGGGKGVVEIFKNKKHVEIYGDGKQIRDFVHVDDIIEALLFAKDWSKGEYQLGSGKGTTILSLAKGKKITFLPKRKEIRESILKNTTPNWKPKIKVLNYLKNIV